MSRLAAEHHIILCCRKRTIASRDHHRRIAVLRIGYMGTDQVIYAVQMAVVHNSLGAADALLRRLEDQLYGSMKRILDRHQNLRDSKADGSMGVMAAGMHKALIYRSKPLSRRTVAAVMLLKHAKGIDIEPHRDRRSFAAAQDSDHAGHSALCVLDKLRIRPLGDGTLILFIQFLFRRNAHAGIPFADLVANKDLISQIRKLSGNDRRRTHFKPAFFRVFVEITALCC